MSPPTPHQVDSLVSQPACPPRAPHQVELHDIIWWTGAAAAARPALQSLALKHGRGEGEGGGTAFNQPLALDHVCACVGGGGGCRAQQ